MALGSDPLTLIMVGGVILIAVALILDEVKPILTPAAVGVAIALTADSFFIRKRI